jgi:hypothetical protein
LATAGTLSASNNAVGSASMVFMMSLRKILVFRVTIGDVGAKFRRGYNLRYSAVPLSGSRPTERML